MILLFNAHRTLTKLVADARRDHGATGVAETADRPWCAPHRRAPRRRFGVPRTPPCGQPSPRWTTPNGSRLEEAVEVAVVGDGSRLATVLAAARLRLVTDVQLLVARRGRGGPAGRRGTALRARLRHRACCVGCHRSPSPSGPWRRCRPVPCSSGTTCSSRVTDRSSAWREPRSSSFAPGRVPVSVHTYFDDADLIEQVVLRTGLPRG